MRPSLFRYPDESLLGEESGYVPPLTATPFSDASLRKDYVLSQDAYGSSVELSLRTSNYPVPGLAVGRLIETADDIGGLIDAYVDANGTVAPQSSLVTGYDFLADAANAVTTELGAGTGHTPDTLIAPTNISPQDPASWSAYQLSPDDNRPISPASCSARRLHPSRSTMSSSSPATSVPTARWPPTSRPA